MPRLGNQGTHRGGLTELVAGQRHELKDENPTVHGHKGTAQRASQYSTPETFDSTVFRAAGEEPQLGFQSSAVKAIGGQGLQEEEVPQSL